MKNYTKALQSPDVRFVVVVEGGLVTNILFRPGEEQTYLILDWDSFNDETDEDPNAIGELADKMFTECR
jgi:hypothetical protein